MKLFAECWPCRWTIAVLALFLFGCGSEEPTIPCEWTDWDHPALTYRNGWVRGELGAEASWSGAAVTFIAPPGQVEVALTDSSGRRKGEANFVSIFYDDELVDRLALEPGRHRYRLPPVEKPTRILIGKATEPMVGTLIFHGVCLSAAPQQVNPQPALAIIGDSITAGYGALASSGRQDFHPSTEGGMQAYGAVTARQQQLGYLARAWSGRGVYRNSDGSQEITLRELWWRPNPLDEDAATEVIEEPVPALIGINLGTNDFAQGQPPAEPFIEAYLALIQDVRERWGQETPLIVMLGTMLQAGGRPGYDQPDLAVARKLLQTVVERRQAGGDKRIYFLEMTPQEADAGFGANYHPSLATHARMASQLTKFIRQQNLMKFVAPDNARDRDKDREPGRFDASGEGSDRATDVSNDPDRVRNEGNP